LLDTKVDYEDFEFIVTSVGGIRAGQLYLGGDRRLLAGVAEDGDLTLCNIKDGRPSRTAASHVAQSPTRYTCRTGVLTVRACSKSAGQLRVQEVPRDGERREMNLPVVPLS
jgi:hypothetical protein